MKITNKCLQKLKIIKVMKLNRLLINKIKIRMLKWNKINNQMTELYFLEYGVVDSFRF
jgi:hypothetical protein